MSNAFAVIMAGGSGTRFWPASRGSRPKQLLPLAGGDEPLVTATVRRISDLVPQDRIYVVTSEQLAVPTRAALPDVPEDNILCEPVGRNTAPCVGWAAAHVRRRDPSGVIAVLPADHHITDEPRYVQVLRRALAAASGGDVVTVGITPRRPETGYGYIETGEEIAEGVHRARRFVEKPNRQRAEQFLAAGNYLWNSGMFFFRADVILGEIEKHLPGLSAALAALDEAASRGEEAAAVRERYPGLPAVSIDHGVMEKAERVAVVPGNFGWSDLGSWMSAWELSPKDPLGNAVQGEAVTVDARGCYVNAPAGKLVALVGVRDLVVVDTEDALLVVPKDHAQDVRDVVDELKSRKDGRV